MPQQRRQREAGAQISPNEPDEPFGNARKPRRLGPFADRHDALDDARHGIGQDDRRERIAQRTQVGVGEPPRQREPVLVERARHVGAPGDGAQLRVGGDRALGCDDVREEFARSERHAHDVAFAQRRAVGDAVGERAVEARGCEMDEHVDRTHAVPARGGAGHATVAVSSRTRLPSRPRYETASRPVRLL